jgi:hypothetical protein
VLGAKAGRGELPPRAGDERAREGGPSCRGLGFRERDEVLGQRRAGDGAPPARDCDLEVAAPRRQASATGQRRHVVREGGERRGVRARGGPRATARQLELAEERLRRREVLRHGSAGGGGRTHRGDRATEVAVQLAQIGDASVRGQAGLEVDEPLEDGLGRGVAAELDERVDAHGLRGQESGHG